MLRSVLPRLTSLLIGWVLLVSLIFGAVAIPAIAAPRWLIPALCYGAALVLTLALAATLTPAAWWYRPTVRGIAIVTGGTWLCGSVLALAAGSVLPATPATPAVATALASVGAHQAPALAPPALPPTPTAPAWSIAPFRVHRSLNLRAGPDVGSTRVAVIPAGAQLTPTGRRHGDWWQVRTDGAARRQTGWVSSLWLRQLAEDPY
ncbi:MAG: SH3 domain-containing protein [Burkholderiaceae bacterium]|nr:SH3 domain-containing protein [Burkholderiaceae bacterium]